MGQQILILLFRGYQHISSIISLMFFMCFNTYIPRHAPYRNLNHVPRHIPRHIPHHVPRDVLCNISLIMSLVTPLTLSKPPPPPSFAGVGRFTLSPPSLSFTRPPTSPDAAASFLPPGTDARPRHRRSRAAHSSRASSLSRGGQDPRPGHRRCRDERGACLGGRGGGAAALGGCAAPDSRG